MSRAAGGLDPGHLDPGHLDPDPQIHADVWSGGPESLSPSPSRTLPPGLFTRILWGDLCGGFLVKLHEIHHFSPSVQFSVISCTHIAVQLSPLLSSRTFSTAQHIPTSRHAPSSRPPARSSTNLPPVSGFACSGHFTQMEPYAMSVTFARRLHAAARSELGSLRAD